MPSPARAGCLKGEVGAFFRSNNNARGGNASVTYATENVSLSYSGACSEARQLQSRQDLKLSPPAAARPRPARDEVGSSAYRSANHTLDLAVKHDNHLFEAKQNQNMPEQLYPNQRMDLLNNEQKRINLRWLGEFAWGKLETAPITKPSSTTWILARQAIPVQHRAWHADAHRRQNHRRHGQSGIDLARAACCAWAANTSTTR